MKFSELTNRQRIALKVITEAIFFAAWVALFVRYR